MLSAYQILRYSLTLFSGLTLFVLIFLSTKYWGTLQAKNLSDIVLGIYLIFALATWGMFNQIGKKFDKNTPPARILHFYFSTTLKYIIFLAIFGAGVGIISLITHNLLSPFLTQKIIKFISITLIIMLVGWVVSEATR